MPCRTSVTESTSSRVAVWSTAAFARRVAAIGALALSACQQPDPIKVEFVAGLSGRAADSGISERNGAQLAIDDANAAGGVGGRKVLFVVRDDEQKPELTARLVAEFADAGVDFTIGPMSGSIAMAGAAVPIKFDQLWHSLQHLSDQIGQRDEQIRELRHALQNVFDATTEVSIIATNADGLIVVFNRGAEKMLGYDAVEVGGHLAATVVHDAAELALRPGELSPQLGRGSRASRPLSPCRASPAKRSATGLTCAAMARA